MKDLSEKITCAEDMLPYDNPNVHLTTPNGKVAPLPWWLKREYLRIYRGVYPESTETIDYLNGQYPQFALHVSKEDPQAVAYTPDKVSGEADRQLKTTLGRFLTKYYPHVADTVIAQVVADHLGELDGSYETITGADITKSYLSAGGTAACMSKSKSGYSTMGHHPSEVYDMPNISMAILRNNSGAIVARCMLYDASPTDKRYIRVYGDLKLKKKLTRAGYKAGSWVGAEFKVIELDGEPTFPRLVMPYLDANGATGSSEHCNVALIGDRLTAVSSKTAQRFRKLFGSQAAVCATNTSGHYNFTKLDPNNLYSVCALSGKIIPDDEEPTKYWSDGKIILIHPESMPEPSSVFYYYSGTSRQTVFAADDTPTFMHGGYIIIDTDAHRLTAGFYKLSMKYYPEEQDWKRQSYPNLTPYRDRNSEVIKLEDAVQVIVKTPGGNAKVYVHQQEVKKGWIKVHSLQRGKDLYAEPDVTIHRTSSGRKVVEGIHNIEQTYKGLWEFARSLSSTHLPIVGVVNYSLKSEVAPSIDNEEGWTLIEEALRKSGDPEADVWTYLQGNHRYRIVNGTSLYAMRNLNWDHVARDIPNSDVQHLCYMLRTLKAEAEALDYNGQHMGPAIVDNLPEPSTVISSTYQPHLDYALAA